MCLAVFCPVVTEICGPTGTCFPIFALMVYQIIRVLLIFSLNAEQSTVVKA